MTRERRVAVVTAIVLVATVLPMPLAHAGDSAAIDQPWWQRETMLFLLIAVLAVVGTGAFVLRLARRERTARNLVEQRTAELSTLNDQLASANRALAAASRSKDEFLAAVSHELRTPLTVISGFVDALGRIRGDDPELDRFLDPIARNVRRLDGLVTDLMTLVSLDAGGITPARAPVDLAGALRGAPRELAGVADEDVVMSVPDGLVVEFDPDHFERVTSNLLVNAVRHGEAPIQVSARDREDGFVEMVVRDHGPGIPDDNVEEVFERFARGPQSAATPGTGLGLAIVRELVELNGGDVTYQSASPGARFIIRLPRATASRPATSPS